MIKILIYLIIASSFLSFGSLRTKIDKNLEVKKFRCSFIGEDTDILHFLEIDSLKDNNDMRLQVLISEYLFFKGDEYLKGYTYNKETNLFEDDMPRVFSLQTKSYRKYKMEITDSTSNGFKLKIESGDNKTYTQINGSSIIIECISEN